MSQVLTDSSYAFIKMKNISTTSSVSINTDEMEALDPISFWKLRIMVCTKNTLVLKF